MIIGTNGNFNTLFHATYTGDRYVDVYTTGLDEIGVDGKLEFTCIEIRIYNK